MIGAVAAERVLDFDLDDELDRGWELYGSAAPSGKALHTDPEDEIAVRLLVLSGLLPMDEDRRVRLLEDDPLVRLASAIMSAAA